MIADCGGRLDAAFIGDADQPFKQTASKTIGSMNKANRIDMRRRSNDWRGPSAAPKGWQTVSCPGAA